MKIHKKKTQTYSGVIGCGWHHFALFFQVANRGPLPTIACPGYLVEVCTFLRYVPSVSMLRRDTKLEGQSQNFGHVHSVTISIDWSILDQWLAGARTALLLLWRMGGIFGVLMGFPLLLHQVCSIRLFIRPSSSS